MERTDTLPRVHAVVVTYLGEEWLPECLDSLAKQGYPRLDVTIAHVAVPGAMSDGARSDGAREIVRSVLPSAEVVTIESNRGFAAAAHEALDRSSLGTGSDFVLFLHDDVALLPEAVHALVEAAADPKVAIVGGKGIDWESGEFLLEVGMSADRLGYAVTDLERREIDHGQHDDRSKTLFVSSACLLARGDVLEKCGSFDEQYFAYCDDLDLCLRVWISGFEVRVAPRAKFRHAVALTSGLRFREHSTVRFLTRRNRLRTLIKNASALRLSYLLPLFLVVLAAEVFLIAAVRRFEELGAYPRALSSVVRSLPSTIASRREVQRRRAVADRHLGGLVSSDLHRARTFLERRIRDWETTVFQRGSDLVGRVSAKSMGERFGHFATRPIVVASVICVLLVVFVNRWVFTTGSVAWGSLWPLPEKISQLGREYFSPWQQQGLGSPAAPSPGLAAWALLGVAGLGRPGLAQKLLVLVLLIGGFAGMYGFLARRTTRRPARFIAAGLYLLSVLASGAPLRADLAAMGVFFAAPVVLHVVFSLLDLAPVKNMVARPTDALIRQSAVSCLLLAAVTAVSPWSWTVLVCASALAVVIALIAGAGTARGAPGDQEASQEATLVEGMHARDSLTHVRVLHRRGGPGRLVLFGAVFAPLAGTVALLFPWSIDALRSGGALASTLGAGSAMRSALQQSWTPFTFADFLGGGRGWISAVVIAAPALTAVLVAPRDYRRTARLLWSFALAVAAIGVLTAHGYIVPVTASPYAWSVLVLFALAAAAGLAIEGWMIELPNRPFGLDQICVGVACLLAASGFAISWVPLYLNAQASKPSRAAPTTSAARSAVAWFEAAATRSGPFRVLWLGRSWTAPVELGMGDPSRHFLLTGPEGLTVSHAYGRARTDQLNFLDSVVGDVAQGSTNRAGYLLGPMNVRFVAVDASETDLLQVMNRQSDFAVEQSHRNIVVFRNLGWLPRAALAAKDLDAAALGSTQSNPVPYEPVPGDPHLDRKGLDTYAGDVDQSSILLSEWFDGAWEARVDGRKLVHTKSFAWANRFAVPEKTTTRVTVQFSGRWKRIAALTLQAFALMMVLAMAKPRPLELPGWVK